MRLISVYDEPQSASILYELLAERPQESWISHAQMPSMDEHFNFMKSRPFRLWFLIEAEDIMNPELRPCFVGAIEATDRNEVGIAILKRHQGRGYGKRAMSMFLASHVPLPAIPAIRNGHWLANIATANERSKAFFASFGFTPLQETLVYG